MPSSTRPLSAQQASKRAMSDSESAPQKPKKARRNPSTEPSTRRDSNRDTKRRKKKKKKTPIVNQGVPRDDVAQVQLGEPSRTPLSARNHIIRFVSAPPDTDQLANAVHVGSDSPCTSSSEHASRAKASCSSRDDTCDRSQVMSSTPNDKGSSSSTNNPIPQPFSSSPPEDKIATLEAELKSKNTLIASHRALLNQVQQAVTCQVCLDLMYKPYALAPCGHLACHGCLVNWFTAPPSDNRPVPLAIARRKTCPHCRAVVRERPVEVWGAKSIAQAVGKSGLLQNQLPIPDEASEGANTDPWKDIFPKSSAPSQRGLPWFFPGDDIDDDDVADDAPRGEDVGMLDMEDGGIYRCLDCMHELWDGICTNCGRVYSGHRPEDDEEYDENPMGWLEDQMGAEEVDIVDDPGWMGLEDGEADDVGGDMDDWHPFDPWQRRFHMFRGPWGFLGTIHVDEEDEDEDDMYDLRVPDDGEESGDEGYESSFIDDGDGRVTTDFVVGPRFYEIEEDEDPVSDDHDEGRRPARVSSDGEADVRDGVDGDDSESLHAVWRSRGRGGHGHGVVESDSESC